MSVLPLMPPGSTSVKASDMTVTTTTNKNKYSYDSHTHKKNCTAASGALKTSAVITMMTKGHAKKSDHALGGGKKQSSYAHLEKWVKRLLPQTSIKGRPRWQPVDLCHHLW